jgi:hypothetical protein
MEQLAQLAQMINLFGMEKIVLLVQQILITILVQKLVQFVLKDYHM